MIVAIIKNQHLAVTWQNSLKIYWPALFLVQIFGRLANGSGPLFGMVLMIAAGLFQWWLIFCALISLARLYFRQPPISKVSKIGIVVGTLVVSVCFYKMSPQAFGDPRSPLERAMSANDVQGFEKILKSNPSLANKKVWANNTPLNAAIGYQHSKEFIDLLVKYGADINAPGWPFDETPLQAAAGEGKVEAVKALLAHHPDVNALHKDKSPAPGGYVVRDTDETALSYAFTADNKEIFKLLLDAGADINRGRSVLAECMIYGGGRDGWPEFLLANGADPNRKGTDADRFMPIIQAILNGNTNYVAALLKYHVDLNTKYENGADNFSPLELAMDERHLDIALMLQDYELQSRSNTVSFAAAHGDLDGVRSLLQKNPQSIEEKDELGFTPLAWAAEKGQNEAASLLLSSGANPDATNSSGRYPIDWAATSGHLPLVEMLADKTSNDKSVTLFLAVQQQQVPVVKFLLEHGANPNIHYPASNTTMPLHLAAGQGNVEEARLLLEHGADVNGIEQNNSTPLIYAIGGTSKEMVELLFAHGASIHEKPGYWSTFQNWALGAGDTNIAALLLAHGADVNAKDGDGKTALHFAAQQGTLQAVEWLLKNGADVNARDNKGATALSLTKFRNRGREIEKRKDVADLLRKYGAK